MITEIENKEYGFDFCKIILSKPGRRAEYSYENSGYKGIFRVKLNNKLLRGTFSQVTNYALNYYSRSPSYFVGLKSTVRKDGMASVGIFHEDQLVLTYIINTKKNEYISASSDAHGGKSFFINDEIENKTIGTPRKYAYVTPSNEAASKPMFNAIRPTFDHDYDGVCAQDYYLCDYKIANKEITILCDINFNILRFNPIIKYENVLNKDGSIQELPLTPIYERKKGEIITPGIIETLYKQTVSIDNNNNVEKPDHLDYFRSF